MHKLKWIYHHVHRFKTEFIRKIRHCPYDCQFHTLQGGIHMFLRIKNKHEQITKTQVYLTGSLVNILRAGMPALYLYQGNLIRAATVQAILEASPEYVCFETDNSIYTISYTTMPIEESKAIA